jgi:hypothetical protein
MGTSVLPSDLVSFENVLLVNGMVLDADVGDRWPEFQEALKDYIAGKPEDVTEIRVRDGWGARLSAPGYMDCTDWDVYATEEEAKKALAEMYDLCEKCLEELDENYNCPECCPECDKQEEAE